MVVYKFYHSQDSAPVLLSLQELKDFIEYDLESLSAGDTMRIECKTITVEEYENLPEWNG